MARLLSGGPFSLGPQTFLQELLQSLRDNSHLTLLEDAISGRNFTYGEVHQKSSAVALKLRELGLGCGDIDTILSNNNAEALIFLIGVWLSGAAATSINPLLPIGEIKRFLEICQSHVVYLGGEFCDRVKEIQEQIPWKISFISTKGDPPIMNQLQIMKEQAPLISEVNQPLGRDHVPMVLFTSGTTGIPKGVQLRDGALSFSSYALNACTLGNRNLNTSHMFWVSCVGILSSSICFGKTMIIGARSPEKILEIISEKKPSFWFSGPSVVLDMCKIQNLERFDLSSLQSLLIAGSPLHSEQRRLVVDHLLGGRDIIGIILASTETGLISYNNCTDNESPRYGSIGKVVNGVVAKIVDPVTGDLLPPFAHGDICVKSPSTIKAYINKEITEKELDKDGFWHMGDLGYYDESGYIFYLSRIKDIMKYRGFQIAPAELEDVILNHPDVIECAVVGKPCPINGELPTAFVVLKSNSCLTEQELSDFVSSKVIDEKKLHGGVYFVEELPKSRVGKILRHEILNNFQG